MGGGNLTEKCQLWGLILKNRNIIRKNFLHDWIVCKCSHKVVYFVSFCKFNYGNFSDPKIGGFRHFADAKSPARNRTRGNSDVELQYNHSAMVADDFAG